MFRKSFKSPIPNQPVSIHTHISCVSPVLTMLLQTSGKQSSTESPFLCIAPFSRQPISNCRKTCRASPVSFRMGWTKLIQVIFLWENSAPAKWRWCTVQLGDPQGTKLGRDYTWKSVPCTVWSSQQGKISQCLELPTKNSFFPWLKFWKMLKEKEKSKEKK